MRAHDDLLTLGTLLPTFLLMKWCLNEWIRLDRRRLTASAQIVLCLCRMRPNVTTMVRDCNTLLTALVRGTKTEAEKGFLPNRRKDGCSKRLGTTRVLLFITITVRACNKPRTAFVRCSKTEAVPAQQMRELMHEETRYGVSLQQATHCICWRHQDGCREGLLTKTNEGMLARRDSVQQRWYKGLWSLSFSLQS